MRTLTTLIAALGIAAAPTLAQQHSMLFTTLGSAQTASGSCGTSLARISYQDVEILEMGAAGVMSAEKYGPHMAWNTLVGDEDGDALYFEAGLSRMIDALVPRRCWTASTPRTLRDVFISVAHPIDGVVSGAPLRPGDIASVQIGGQFEYFIKQEHILTALNFPIGTQINIDAAAVDRQGNIFLSFERDWALPVGLSFRDGAVIAIPAPAITYDAMCNVFSVVPGSAVVALTEMQVNAMVVNANASDASGAQAMAIRDLDGLNIDPGGGVFTVAVAGVAWTFPNLWFCGERLTGGGVLSTAGGGSVALFNGFWPLAATPAAPTTGAQVGLAVMAGNFVPSLNGLATWHPQATRFVLDTPTPQLAGPGNIVVDWGGAGPAVLLGLRFGPIGPGNVALSIPFANPGFPDYYAPFVWVPGASCPLGFGSFTFPYGGGGGGLSLLFQALTIQGGALMLSAPETIQL